MAATYPPVELPDGGSLERRLLVSPGAVTLVAVQTARSRSAITWL